MNKYALSYAVFIVISLAFALALSGIAPLAGVLLVLSTLPIIISSKMRGSSEASD